MFAAREVGDAPRSWARLGGLGIDGASLVVFSLAGPLLAVLGGGRLGLASTVDAATVLAALACVGPAVTTRDLTGRDRLVLVASAVTWLALDGHIVAVGLTAAGVWGWRRASAVPRGLAGLWLAIAVHVLWAPLAFRFVGRWVIAAEMTLIGDAARLLMPAVVLEGARIQAVPGWYVYVLEGCSAFAGMSTAALVWLATMRLLGAEPSARAAMGFVAGLCGVVAVNVARILLMLPSAEAYLFWHDGPGSTVVVASGIALGAAPALATAARR